MSDDHYASLLNDARRWAWPVCLDTSAMLSFLLDEPAAPAVAGLLNDPALSTVISTVTLAEVGVRPARNDPRGPAVVAGRVLGLPRMRVLDVDPAIAVEAALVRAGTGLRLPDAIVVATGRITRAALVIGNDRQWRHKDLGLPFVLLDELSR